MAIDRAVSIVNGKGGVLKTSITSNVGGLLAEAGHRVLLIDMDPQGNLGEDLGYSDAEENDEGHGLLQAVIGGTPLQPIEARDRLDVVPGGHYLEDLAAMIRSREQRDSTSARSALAKSLAPIAANYVAILIDCPPGESTLQDLALGASRWVLIPIKTDASSRKGLRRVATRFTAAREYNPELALLGVVLTGSTTSAKRVRRQAREAAEAELGHVAPVFDTTIRHVEAGAVDARNRGQLVHELERDVIAAPKWYERLRDGNSDSGNELAKSARDLAADYQALSEELVERLLSTEQETVA